MKKKLLLIISSYVFVALFIFSSSISAFAQSSPDLDTLFENDALNHPKEFIDDSEFMNVEEFQILCREIAERA